jgi:hypothetical protein
MEAGGLRGLEERQGRITTISLKSQIRPGKPEPARFSTAHALPMPWYPSVPIASPSMTLAGGAKPFTGLSEPA